MLGTWGSRMALTPEPLSQYREWGALGRLDAWLFRAICIGCFRKKLNLKLLVVIEFIISELL